MSEFEQWPERSAPSHVSLSSGSATAALTAREMDVLRKLAEGKSRQELAEELFVSINTLKSQLSSLYRKLGVSSRTKALLEAERRGLI